MKQRRLFTGFLVLVGVSASLVFLTGLIIAGMRLGVNNVTWAWYLKQCSISGDVYGISFYLLWWISIVSFMRTLGNFSKDKDGPDRVASSILLVGVGILGVSAYYWKARPAVLAAILKNGAVSRGLLPGLQHGVVTSFPFVWAAFGLAIAVYYFRWGNLDPIEAELRKQIRWPKKVNHAKGIEEGKKRGLTYLGFEVGSKGPVFITPEERNKHTQILGSTGSGKTRFALFPMMAQDIAQGHGVVFIDAKGSSENAKTVFQMVQAAGREKDFCYFSLTDLEHSTEYDPLRHGNSSQLKDKIAGSIDWSEPFYQRTCENALQALFMEMERDGERFTLGRLYEVLKDPPIKYAEFRDIAARNKKNIETLPSEIGLLVNTPFGRFFEAGNGGIDLLEAYKQSKVVYFALDTQGYQQTAMRVGKMITQDINTLSGIIESQFTDREKRPLAVYIDEYQAFGTRGFINALARGRSSGLWITIAHQSLGDLKAIDDAYCQQVIENTNTKIFLRVNDPETAQLFSDTVGTGKSVATTGQVHIEGEDPKNIMGSVRVVQEYLIHPTEVKQLDVGHGVFKCGKRFGRVVLDGFFKDVSKIELPIPEKSAARSKQTEDRPDAGPKEPPEEQIL